MAVNLSNWRETVAQPTVVMEYQRSDYMTDDLFHEVIRPDQVHTNLYRVKTKRGISLVSDGSLRTAPSVTEKKVSITPDSFPIRRDDSYTYYELETAGGEEMARKVSTVQGNAVGEFAANECWAFMAKTALDNTDTDFQIELDDTLVTATPAQYAKALDKAIVQLLNQDVPQTNLCAILTPTYLAGLSRDYFYGSSDYKERAGASGSGIDRFTANGLEIIRQRGAAGQDWSQANVPVANTDTRYKEDFSNVLGVVFDKNAFVRKFYSLPKIQMVDRVDSSDWFITTRMLQGIDCIHPTGVVVIVDASS